MFVPYKVAALIDTGCSIHVVSESLYDTLSPLCKSCIHPLSQSSTQFGDSNRVDILGKASVKGRTPYGLYSFTLFTP